MSWIFLFYLGKPAEVLAQGMSLDQASFQDRCRALFPTLEVPCRPLKEYLLSDQKLVKSWLEAYRRTNSALEGWKDLHQQRYAEAGFCWPFPCCQSPLAHIRADVLKALTEREKDVLQFVLLKGNAEGGRVAATDLSQSLGRTPTARPNHISCILPVSDIILLELPSPRLLTPLEAMALQGMQAECLGLDIHPHRPGCHSGSGDWKWREIFDLAGNAFCGQCVGAAILVALGAGRL